MSSYPGKGAMQSTAVVTATVATPTATVIKQGDVEMPFPVEYSNTNDTDDAGKGMGIAMVICTSLSLLFAFIPVPFVSFVCMIATIIISSILVCGCCCAQEYRLKPNVKKFALATLVCCSLIFILQIIYIAAVLSVAANEAAATGTISTQTAQGAGAGAFALWIIVLLLNVGAIVFSSMFTCGRKCCSN
eukprot:CAMPEP_0197434438 /NCGR_PEP_ID=MMETSP1175-20131217/2169_1 /TAXON_ID=1003142 /ORGANISM="Triceratium dubium, Strain CCMP147" /LENGTH=188 /DNA_ID=CAMNT_0042963155 /DNA_START=155 /DNA_END=721 /DNA_ORIENTATION=-